MPKVNTVEMSKIESAIAALEASNKKPEEPTIPLNDALQQLGPYLIKKTLLPKPDNWEIRHCYWFIRTQGIETDMKEFKRHMKKLYGANWYKKEAKKDDKNDDENEQKNDKKNEQNDEETVNNGGSQDQEFVDVDEV